MDQKNQEQGSEDSVVRLYVMPRNRAVPPLTDGEILALRRLLIDADTIRGSCPVAKRLLSDR